MAANAGDYEEVIEALMPIVDAKRLKTEGCQEAKLGYFLRRPAGKKRVGDSTTPCLQLRR